MALSPHLVTWDADHIPSHQQQAELILVASPATVREILVTAQCLVDVALALAFDAMEESKAAVESQLVALCTVIFDTAPRVMEPAAARTWRVEAGRAIAARLGSNERLTTAGVVLHALAPDAMTDLLSCVPAGETAAPSAADGSRLRVAALLALMDTPAGLLHGMSPTTLMTEAISITAAAAGRRRDSTTAATVVTARLRGVMRMVRNILARLDPPHASEWMIEASRALSMALLDESSLPGMTHLAVLQAAAPRAVERFEFDWNALVHRDRSGASQPRSLLADYDARIRSQALAVIEGDEPPPVAPDDTAMATCLVDTALLLARARGTYDRAAASRCLGDLGSHLLALAGAMPPADGQRWLGTALERLLEDLTWRPDHDGLSLGDQLGLPAVIEALRASLVAARDALAIRTTVAVGPDL